MNNKDEKQIPAVDIKSALLINVIKCIKKKKAFALELHTAISQDRSRETPS